MDGNTLSGAFIFGSHQWYHTGIYLDAGNDATLFQQLNEGGAIVGLLVQSLVEEDHTRNVFTDNFVAGEQQLAVLASVLIGVLCRIYIISFTDSVMFN